MKIRWRLFADENEPVTRQRGMRVYEELQRRGVDAGPLGDREDGVDVIVCQYDPGDLEILRGRCDYLVFDLADAIFLPHHPRRDLFLQSAAGHCDWMLCCSSQIKRHLDSIFDANCVTVFPEAVDNTYRDVKRQPSGRNKIVWMGMQDNALFFEPIDHVFESLHNAGYAFEVVFVHPDRNGFGQSNKKMVESKNYPTRHVTWELGALLEEMRTADIAVCPVSQNEWCRCKSANKAASFAAAGIPVVATDIPSYREFITHGESGYLCFSPDDWYEPLDLLLASKSLQKKIGAAGRSAALELYSIERVCDIFENVIDRMVI